jgi:peptidoglycan/xylan/chitin deacetylase (PgdA/CDA1 family)
MRPLALLAIAFFSAIACRSSADSAPSVHSKAKIQQVDRYVLEIQTEVYRSVPELSAQQRIELTRGVVLRKLMRGNPNKKQIAITFDDGPHPEYTPKLLAILKQCDAKATFFVVGRKAKQYPDLVRAEIAAGHEVGNHTYDHLNLTKLPIVQAAAEIQACGDVLKSITHKKTAIFRPPGGDYNTEVGGIANDLGYTIILWTDDPGDYADPAKKVLLNRTLDRVENGGIILIHDGVQETIDLLPTILQTLKDHGYEFVTIHELMKGKP